MKLFDHLKKAFLIVMLSNQNIDFIGSKFAKTNGTFVNYCFFYFT